MHAKQTRVEQKRDDETDKHTPRKREQKITENRIDREERESNREQEIRENETK